MQNLFDALSRGDRPAVCAILDDTPELLDAERDGTSAILFSVYTGHSEIVEEFLARGRKLRFHEACALGDEDSVEAMVKADPALASAFSPDGFSPVALAIFFRHPSLAQQLIERGGAIDLPSRNLQRVAPVHAAAAVSDRETMKILLERGADPDARQQNDFTPLHAAASHGDVEMATLLIAHGADPDVRTADGLSVLDIARRDGQAAFEDAFARLAAG